MRRVILYGVLMLAIFGSSFAQHQPSERTADFERTIEKILNENHVPGAALAIVTRDGSLLVRGFGKANIESGAGVNEHTLFRIASISKMFVALSILKLQEEGRLRLHDKVRDVVPEVEFENPWEGTDPVRIVHLLEHTTGWDEQHLVEQTNVPLTLRQGLDYHPHSRRSRWVPGSRMAYTNSGYGVAGYIVEKVSGQPYEQYVEENFFQPMAMANSTFFDDERYQKHGAALYDRDLNPLPYRHVIQRPSGAINSTATDMASFLRFLLNEGRVDSTQLIRAASLARMRITESTPELELGYGLANFTSVYQGYVYQGHTGGLPGALSELAYLPEHGIGHVILMNTTNGIAFTAISNAVRDFEIGTIADDVAASPPPRLSDFTFRDGYYIPVNPRVQWGFFLDRIVDVYSFRKRDSVLFKTWIFPGASETFYPVSESRFHSGGSNRVSLVKAVDPLAGEVLVTDSRVYKPIPAVVVYAQLCVLAGWIGMMGVGSLVWMIALATHWSGTSRSGLSVSNHPMLASVLAVVLIYFVARANTLGTASLAAPGLFSLTLLALSVWFMASTVLSIVAVYRYRKSRIPRLTYWSMALLSLLHVIVVAYLVWYDALPVISWA